MALAFARQGCHVAVNYLDDRDAALQVAAEALAAGGKSCVVQGDVAQVAPALAMVEAAARELGGLDVLVNNAGVYPRVPFLDMRESDWDLVLDVNLKGTFFCAQAAARVMIAGGRRGAIINLASQAIRGAVRGTHYTASKGGVVAMTRAIALELAPHGIRVNPSPPASPIPPSRATGARKRRSPSCRTRSPSAAWPSPRTSPTWPSFSPPTRPATSRARPSTSTAASTCPRAMFLTNHRRRQWGR